MQSQVKFEDFYDICRFCLGKCVFLKPIFSEDDGVEDDFASDDGNGNESVTEMVKLCTGLEISVTDDLPNFMCSKCLKILLECNKFRRQCLRSEEVLKEAVLRYQSGLDGDADVFGSLVLKDTIEITDTESYLLEGNELEEIKRQSDLLFVTEPIQTNEAALKSSINIDDSSECREFIQLDGNATKRKRDEMVVGNRHRNFTVKVKAEKTVKVQKQYRSCRVHQTGSKSLRSYCSRTLLHNKRDHSRYRRHGCNKCYKWFLTKQSLRKHFQIHLKVGSQMQIT